MNRKLDVDAAANEIERRRESWQQSGFSVGDLTFRDQAREWPNQVVEGRSNALAPDSVGVALRHRAVEARIVLYAYGWVDWEWANLAERDLDIHEGSAVEVLSTSSFGELLDQLADEIKASSDKWPGGSSA